MKFEKIKNLVFAKRQLLFAGASFLFWVIFYYVEGYLLWGIKTPLGGDVWTMDLIGHGLAGIMFSITLFFLLRNATSPRGTFRVLEHWLQGTIVIFISILLASIGWEILELAHDLIFNPEVPAQINSFDTMSDIVVTSVFSLFGVLMYLSTLKYLKKIYPDAHLQEIVDRLEVSTENLFKETRKQNTKAQKQIITTIRKQLRKFRNNKKEPR